MGGALKTENFDAVPQFEHHTHFHNNHHDRLTQTHKFKTIKLIHFMISRCFTVFIAATHTYTHALTQGNDHLHFIFSAHMQIVNYPISTDYVCTVLLNPVTSVNAGR